MIEHPAIANLHTEQTPLDADGVMVAVSREALDQALELIDRLTEARYRLALSLNESLEQNEACFLNHYGENPEGGSTPEYIRRGHDALRTYGPPPVTQPIPRDISAVSA